MSIHAQETTLQDYMEIQLMKKLSIAHGAAVYDPNALFKGMVDADAYLDVFEPETIYSYTTPGTSKDDVIGFELQVLGYVDREDNQTIVEPETCKFAIAVAEIKFTDDELSEVETTKYLDVVPFSNGGELHDALQQTQSLLIQYVREYVPSFKQK